MATEIGFGFQSQGKWRELGGKTLTTSANRYLNINKLSLH